MKKFRVSVAADADLRAIAEYTLEQWGAERRDAYITKMFDAFARLADMPDIAAKLNHIREGYRRFPLQSHVIYFRSSSTHTIEIVRVLHKRMDAEAHLSSH